MIKCYRLPDDIKHEIETYILYKKCLICGIEGVCYKQYYTCTPSCTIKALIFITFSSILFIFYCIVHLMYASFFLLASIVLTMLYIILYVLHIVVSLYIHLYIVALLINRIYESMFI